MADDANPQRPGDQRDDDALSAHVVKNLNAVAEMHLQSERTLSAHQKAIESVTGRLGRPASLYFIVALVLLWTVGDTLGPRLGLRALDPPPFPWLQGLIGLAALLTATMVLSTQNRQAKLSERRMHLDLQVNLLTEQKTAKLIELIEELRRDLPNVRDRRDTEAEIMQRAAEPLRVFAALEEQTLEAVREALAPDSAAEPQEEED
jgi:uncharacterized membrane protein